MEAVVLQETERSFSELIGKFYKTSPNKQNSAPPYSRVLGLLDLTSDLGFLLLRLGLIRCRYLNGSDLQALRVKQLPPDSRSRVTTHKGLGDPPPAARRLQEA